MLRSGIEPTIPSLRCFVLRSYLSVHPVVRLNTSCTCSCRFLALSLMACNRDPEKLYLEGVGMAMEGICGQSYTTEGLQCQRGEAFCGQGLAVPRGDCRE